MMVILKLQYFENDLKVRVLRTGEIEVLKEKIKVHLLKLLPSSGLEARKFLFSSFCIASDIWDSTFWVVLLTDMY